jgi:hypothetical protein
MNMSVTEFVVPPAIVGRSRSVWREIIDTSFCAVAPGEEAEALYVMPDPLMFIHRLRINTLALGARLPTMHSLREFVEASGLISYGPSWVDQWRRAADSGTACRRRREPRPADPHCQGATKLPQRRYSCLPATPV